MDLVGTLDQAGQLIAANTNKMLTPVLEFVRDSVATIKRISDTQDQEVKYIYIYWLESKNRFFTPTEKIKTVFL